MKPVAKPLPLTGMQVTDRFFAPRIDLVRTQMLPYQWEALNDRLKDTEPSHCIENFRIAAGISRGEYHGMVFQDSDLYKWLEAVAYQLAVRPDPSLREAADSAIRLIGQAQTPEGYLNTYYQTHPDEKRFSNLQNNHELYCAGHLIEAAVAFAQAVGDTRLLDVARRYADLIDRVFGPEEGKLHGYPGHEIIEMALVRLFRLTGEERYLRLARYFIDQRGQAPLYFEEEARRDGNRDFVWNETFMRYQYYQAGKPVREQTEAEGHAVRAVYLYSGMADVAAETGDQTLFEACRTLFDNIVSRRMYITGAIGSTHVGEAFTYDYDLPNESVYAETCAQIGLCFFAQRMLNSEMDGRYADVIERALYNSVLSGMSLDAKRFFYVNPLEVVPEACEKDDRLRHVKPQRQKWFGCACCPPNLARFLGSLPSYAFSAGGDTLYMHLYIGGEVRVALAHAEVHLSVESDYPWDGRVRLTVHTPGEYGIAVRISGWCRGYELKVNGESVSSEPVRGYVSLNRVWREEDMVELNLKMPVTLMRANPAVRADTGKLCVVRGPLVYSLEEADNGKDLHLLRLPLQTAFEVHDEPQLLGGIRTIRCNAFRRSKSFAEGQLYAPVCGAEEMTETQLTWIPYFAWANREPGEMAVWIREV
jgi:DUF1680 family protein